MLSCFVDGLVPGSGFLFFFSFTPLQLKLNFKEDESKGEISLVGIKEGKEVSRADGTRPFSPQESPHIATTPLPDLVSGIYHVI